MPTTLRLPIGYDIFRELIDNNLDFIDKTLLIKDIFENPAKIMLFTRPRRFGKTLNLSMLHHFVAAEAFGQKTQGLFKGFKISDVDGGKYMEHQGKYPAIFITLKDVKDHNFEHAYPSIEGLISNVYREHRYLLESPKLDEGDKKLFRAILNREVNADIVATALKTLCQYLHAHFDSKVWLFLDEYDTPIQEAYVRGYYDEMINFMRNMFGSALKTNPYLHKAVITGILRISKESLFSNLNNLEVYSVLENKYSQYFGFTEEEVNYILQRSGLENKATEIKDWYNGYQFGNTIVYNPWLIIHVVNKNGVLKPYWINTSGNDLIREIIIKSKPEIKERFEYLLQGKPIQVMLDEHVTFGDLHTNETAIFSLLLAAGYIKATHIDQTEEEGFKATLEIPNREVRSVYRGMIKQWLARNNDIIWFNHFMENLLEGHIAEFAVDLKAVMLQIVSCHDVGKEPEAFYQGLMLGFAAGLDPKQYEIKSNRESGYGFYDVAIIPKDIQKSAVILELKSVSKVRMLKKEAEKALTQIEKREYESEIKQRGIINIIKIGLAFCGKEFVVKW